MPAYTNIIPATDLQALLPACTVLDCRAKLGDVEWGKNAYLTGHVPTARHADLDQDLAATPGLQGRHPLPNKQAWLDCVRGWGITQERQVVLYDDAGGPYAARAWWMLRWLGHTTAAVLDGGLQLWPGPLETGPASTITPSAYPQAASLTKIISSDQLLQLISTATAPILVDARTEHRWAGHEEPIDAVAGHIPGALCYPFQDNLDKLGCFKSPAELREQFKALGADGTQDIICYCGSGVTAAHNILAMNLAQMTEAILFADSWSGWISDPDRPIATVT